MTAGSEISQYTGNAGLGLGSNADIPAIYSDNSVINQTSRDLMLLNHEDNVRKWERKNKERDAVLEKIANGQVSTEKILDDDRNKVITPLQKDADKALEELAKNPNDQKLATQYQKAFQKLNDAATWAQHRFVGNTAYQKALREATTPEDKERIQKSFDEENKLPFWEGQYLEPQKLLDYNWDKVNSRLTKGVSPSSEGETQSVTTTQTPGKPTTVKTTIKTGTASKTKGTTESTGNNAGEVGTTTRTDKDGKVYQVTQGSINFEPIRKNAIDDYNTPQGGQEQRVIREHDEMLPDEMYEPMMNDIVKRITQHNDELGLKPSGVPNYQNSVIDPTTGYIDPKVLSQKLGIDPNTGKRTGGKVMLSTPDYNAIKALAAIPGNYATKTEKLDEKATELNLKIQAEKDKVAEAKAKIGVDYAKLALDKVKFKDESKLKWYQAKQKLKTNEDKGVWVNDQTVSLINNAKQGTVEKEGKFKGMHKTTSKALVDMFTTTRKVGSTSIVTKPVAVYIDENNDAIPVYGDGDKVKQGEKMSADELKAKIAETQFGKNAQTVLDASNQVLENVVGGSSLNKNVDKYYQARNTGEKKLKDEYSLGEKTFTVDQVKKAAKQSGLSVEDYIKQAGLE